MQDHPLKHVRSHYFPTQRHIPSRIVREVLPYMRGSHGAKASGSRTRAEIEAGVRLLTQIDLIDRQSNPDGPLKFILNYQTLSHTQVRCVHIFCRVKIPFHGFNRTASFLLLQKYVFLSTKRCMSETCSCVHMFADVGTRFGMK